MGISSAQLMHLARPLGWTLLHSLWQGAAVAAALAIALPALRGRSPQTRYVASLAALGLIVLAVAITFAQATPGAELHASVAASATVLPSAAIGPAPGATTTRGPAASSGVIPVKTAHETQITSRIFPASPVAAPSPEPLPARIDHILPWLSAAWAAGVALVSLWHLGGWIAAQRLRVLGIQRPDQAVEKLAVDLCGRLGFDLPVRVVISFIAQTPMVIGWLRPIVLLPISVVTGLTPAQLEGILAHELAHIRRHDYLVNLLQVVAETLLFYHPAVWWISRRIRLERERCCDAIAVGASGDPCGYAESLARVEQVRLGQALALAAAGAGRGEMLSRVRTILGVDDEVPRRAAHGCVAAMVLLVVAMVPFSLSRGAPANTSATQPNADHSPSSPCIVLHGGTDRPGYPCVDAEGRGSFAVFVTAKPLDDATLAQYAQRLNLQGPMGRPTGTARGSLDTFTFNLGAPYIHDGDRDGQFWRTNLFLIFDDVAGWHPTDADYAQKVRQVLDNLQKQLGGDWRLENRDLEQPALQPAAGPPDVRNGNAEPIGAASPAVTRPAIQAAASLRTVLLVTPGSYFLEHALATMADSSGLSLATVSPREFRALAERRALQAIASDPTLSAAEARALVRQQPLAALVVFDRWAPEAPPVEAALYVDAIPPNSGLSIEQDAKGQPVITRNQQGFAWSLNDPVLEGMQFGDPLFIAEALKLHAPADWRSLASNRDGKFIVAHDRPGARQIVIAFDVQQSNWPFKSSFPIFLHRASHWLIDGTATGAGLNQGQAGQDAGSGGKVAATQPAGSFVAECVLSGTIEGHRKTLAKASFNADAGSPIQFLYPGKPPLIIERTPGREAGIRAQVKADPQQDGTVRIFCRLQKDGAADGSNYGMADETLLGGHAQALVVAEKELKEAQHLLNMAQQDLETRRLGLSGTQPYTAEEICRVDPTLRAKMNARSEQQIIYDQLLTRYGTNYPSTLEARHLLEVRQRDVEDAVKRFNEQYFILQSADGTPPRIISKDLTKLRALVAEWQKRFDDETNAVNHLAHSNGSETGQIVKLGEPVAVELADGTRLEVSIHTVGH